jgi:hypothetical protein
MLGAGLAGVVITTDRLVEETAFFLDLAAAERRSVRRRRRAAGARPDGRATC